jgi:hypothetical protein
MFDMRRSVCIRGLLGSSRTSPIRSNLLRYKVPRHALFQIEWVERHRVNPRPPHHPFVDVDAGAGHQQAYRVGAVGQHVWCADRRLRDGAAESPAGIVQLETRIPVH